MKYKLIENSLNDITNPKQTILLNRGIKDWELYLNLNENCTYDYRLLENIDEAVKCFKSHVSSYTNIHIIVDSDVDGYTSASMIYRYIKYLDDEANVTYSLHTKKQHGISDDITIPNDCNLLIVPDAGSNDIEQCKKLKEQGIDVLILDHHICDKENNYAIVVNNQIGSYPNNNLCGAGVVYKFLKAVDEELWNDFADKLLDMVALGNISDVMDMREYETRYYVDLGLTKITSKLLRALIEKQSYSMKNKVNITSIQYYITPILNAMIRVGSNEDKEVLFRAFIETDEVFKYKKRGETEETDEDIYTRAARLCVNAKSRQDKEVQKSVAAIDEIIEKQKSDYNKILFINVSDVLGETLTGLVAMKLADKYNKPCLLLRRQAERDDGSLYYGGSCRNFDNSPISSLKNFLESTNTFEYIQGHDNAAGISIPRANVKKSIEICNKMLEKVDFSKYFEVDFEIDSVDFSVGFIKEISEMKHIFGQGIKEPYICVKNVEIYADNIFVMGNNLDCWKFTDDEGFAIVNFGVDKDNDYVLNAFENTKYGYLGTIDMIGKVDISEYKGILTPQFIISDYIVRSKNNE